MKVLLKKLRNKLGFYTKKDISRIESLQFSYGHACGYNNGCNDGYDKGYDGGYESGFYDGISEEN